MSVVLDCSVAAAWCFEDEQTPAALDVLDRIAEEAADVPSLWCLELANILLVGERRKRITASDAGRFVALISDLPLRVDPGGMSLSLVDVLGLARRHSLTAYDAAYLELATRLKSPLVSKDTALLRAARDAEVEVIAV